MAQAAVLRETCRHVVRIGRAVEICQMARDARSREPGKHVVFVTLGTRRDTDVSARSAGTASLLWLNVAPCQFVVEWHRLQSCGKPAADVVRIGRAVEICQMARDTSGREPGEHVVFMTLGTRSDTDMSSGQRERRRCGVVERRALPIRR